MGIWRKLFINRDFGLLFVGRLVSQIGDGIHYFAMAWLVLDLTGSGTALGTMLMAAAAPGIVLSPFAGVLADTWSRKTIIVAMDVVRGLLIVIMALVHWHGLLTLPLLYVVTIVLSLCGALFGPAVSAAVPELVRRDELVKANARNSFSRSSTGILGPIVGALLLGWVGYTGVFVINGLSFLLSAFSEIWIRLPHHSTVASQSGSPVFLQNLQQGFRYIWSQSGLKLLIFGGIILNFLFNPLFGVVFPYLGKEVLLMSAEHFGFTQSSFPAGLLLGTLLVAALAQRMQKKALLIGGIAVQGGLVLGLSLLTIPAVYAGLSPGALLAAFAGPLALMGVANVQVNVPLNVMIQETVPSEYRGRVFALLESLLQAAVPLGMGLFGLLLDLIPLSLFFIATGTVTLLLALVFGAAPAAVLLFATAAEPGAEVHSSS